MYYPKLLCIQWYVPMSQEKNYVQTIDPKKRVQISSH
jgi:hypothetical protein